MVTIMQMRQQALSFSGTTEEAHFEKISFRYKNRIFATYDAKNNKACLKFSEIDQNVFCSADSKIIMPVPNKWGKQGWTFVDLQTVHEDLFSDALKTAYEEVSKKK